MNLRDSLGVLVAGAVLSLLCLAGVAWIAMNRDLFTVDGLFMAIILLTIAGVLGLELLYEMRRKDEAEGTVRGASATRSAATAAAAPGTVSETGFVENVQFYEAPVGEPTRTVVALRNGAGKAPQLLTFEGNVLHLLPKGRRVRIVYRPAGDLNVLVAAEKR